MKKTSFTSYFLDALVSSFGTRIIRKYSPHTFLCPVRDLSDQEDVKVIPTLKNEVGGDFFNRKRIYIISAKDNKEASFLLQNAFGGRKVYAPLGEASKEEKDFFNIFGKEEEGNILYSFVLKDGFTIDKDGNTFQNGNLSGFIKGNWQCYKKEEWNVGRNKIS